MPIYLLIFILLSSTSSFFFPASSESIKSFSAGNSPWKPTQNLTLLSPNSSFAAGFRRSPVTAGGFVFSVWYANISSNSNDDIVWSANWGSPVKSSASLIIASNGDLQLIDGARVWNISAPVNSSSTQLLLRDDGDLRFGSWSSLEHPTDTILQGQSINGTVLTSRNGKFTFTGSKSLIFNGSDNYWNSSQGLVMLGFDGTLTEDASGSTLSADFDQTRTRRLTLNDDGNLRIWSFDPDKKQWVKAWEAFQEICTAHGLCGSGAICYSNGSTESDYECVCPPGFEWSLAEPGSCQPKIRMSDPGKTKFLRLDYVNYTGGSNQTDLKIPNFNQCQSRCLANPRCLGFAFKYDGSGYCVLQLDRLLYGYWSPGDETVFYLRVDQSEQTPSNFTGMADVLTTMCPVEIGLPNPPKESKETARNIIIITALFTVEIASGVLLFWAFLKRYVKYRDMARTLGLGLLPTAGPKRFSYAEIRAATKDFSEENLIGKGGFSDVYMGKLQDGRPVAVKCLKDVSGGDTEFWAEVTIIARMHHLNLVRLWGFCNEKGRRILIYEHVSNGSLNEYLFRPRRSGSNTNIDSSGEMKDSEPSIEQKPLLDWSIRYRIALGVARAIAYLHEECLEWVLHCDIKPENILLGDDFCPKVADFGLSKLRKKEQLVTRSRIRGTRGYLAPEWTKNDSITSKVDVYSFGMVLLEIVTGKRNTMPGPSAIPSEDWYFPKWAFEMAIEERRIDEILDGQIKDSFDNKVHLKMVDRMVKTAMWCLQEKPEMRPSMGKVAKMLEGTVEIMDPPRPTIFFIG